MTKIDRNWDKVIENNFLDKISDLPTLHPKMRIYRYSANVGCVFGLVESDTFNVIFGGNFDDPRITVIAKEIISLYRKKNLPYAWCKFKVRKISRNTKSTRFITHRN
ncbi:MAG: hypothetical protein ACEY3B_05170 [Wolbachia sp.]